MLFIYITEVCLIFSVIALLSTSGTSLTLLSQYKEGCCICTHFHPLLLWNLWHAKCSVRAPCCIPTCYVEALMLCSCLSIACQKPEFNCSGICKLYDRSDKCMNVTCKGAQFFLFKKNSGCLTRTLADRLVAWRKLCTEDPQILGGTAIQNLVACTSLAQWNKWSALYVAVMYLISYDWGILIVCPS